MVSNERFRDAHYSYLGVAFNCITDTDILHLNMMGTHLVVLNNDTVTMDLLEQRSAAYADRVPKPFGIPFTILVLTDTYG
jgi:hypothetical protein